LRLTIVAAIAGNGVIGRAGSLPWHLPDDLRHFKALTLGRPILMGRRTFESIGRPLAGRRNLVLTRSAQPLPPGTEAFNSLPSALQACALEPEVCVIGGVEVFRAALPLTDRLELTLVRATPEGDVFFPELELSRWREVARIEHAADERHAHAMTFVTLDRKSPEA
jgi:dihydrofolate reductase